MSNSSHLNVPRLVTWLSSRLPEFQGPIEIKKFPGGQSNPTFCFLLNTNLNSLEIHIFDSNICEILNLSNHHCSNIYVVTSR